MNKADYVLRQGQTRDHECERFVPVVGFEGLYEVSNFGRVRSLPKQWVCGTGRVCRHPGLYMKHRAVGHGYVGITLCRDGKETRKSVHILVATHFVPNPHGLPEVNHCDGVKANCRADNLEWTTRSGNCKHAWATGLNRHTDRTRQARVERNKARAKLSGEDRATIKARAALGESVSVIAKDFPQVHYSRVWEVSK